MNRKICTNKFRIAIKQVYPTPKQTIIYSTQIVRNLWSSLNYLWNLQDLEAIYFAYELFSSTVFNNILHKVLVLSKDDPYWKWRKIGDDLNITHEHWFQQIKLYFKFGANRFRLGYSSRVCWFEGLMLQMDDTFIICSFWKFRVRYS